MLIAPTVTFVVPDAVELLSIALQIDLARQKFRPSAKREKGETSC
jgi:hypothetical protein